MYQYIYFFLRQQLHSRTVMQNLIKIPFILFPLKKSSSPSPEREKTMCAVLYCRVILKGRKSLDEITGSLKSVAKFPVVSEAPLYTPETVIKCTDK